MSIMAYAPYGSEGLIIRVEADIRRGIPGIDISGLAEGAVREARERVRAAFRNSGLEFPLDRLLINLAPAGVRKDGAALDLPIALAVMVAAKLAPAAKADIMVLGELELSGRLRPVRGVLAAAAAGIDAGIRDFIVPADNAREAAVLAPGHYAAAATLGEAVQAFRVFAGTGVFPAIVPGAGNPAAGERSGGRGGVAPGVAPGAASGAAPGTGDFAEVKGQGSYKRALEIAAAGGHNLLVFGPPGAGKTMLARRISSIMAPLETWEAVEVTRLHSLAGQFGEDLITRPPFRAPHHSASAEGILGGGRTVRPGEISLAHFGTLFLDEAPEFRTNVLQALREPLEDRVLTVVRAEGPVRLPADFQLLMAANPCPCGRLGIRFDSGHPGSSGCFCSPDEIHRYWKKFSGALMDRIELRIPVRPPEIGQLEQGGEEKSASIARRVGRAAAIQRERFQGTVPGVRRNARMPAGLTEQCCPLTVEARRTLHQAVDRLSLSGRAYHGILRVARTIADLEGAEVISSAQVAEAVQYRRRGEDPYDILAD
ncbi:MAG: YifB family Mg chelatase-like AAA ATPase [Treponema sp.]|jgi:magnesium chelatase family protein|nr:YifB family Mg chelatase-like AAA ATPase [Treponema sp.]